MLNSLRQQFTPGQKLTVFGHPYESIAEPASINDLYHKVCRVDGWLVWGSVVDGKLHMVREANKRTVTCTQVPGTLEALSAFIAWCEEWLADVSPELSCSVIG